MEKRHRAHTTGAPTAQNRTLVACLRPNAPLVGNLVLPTFTKEMAWRFHDHPMRGTIFRLPDDMSLQRGITFTILPDGKMIQVPSMSRMMVRAASSSHDENDEQQIVKALQDILKGKKSDARPRDRRRPHIQREPANQRGQIPILPVQRGEGLRPAIIEEA